MARVESCHPRTFHSAAELTVANDNLTMHEYREGTNTYDA